MYIHTHAYTHIHMYICIRGPCADAAATSRCSRGAPSINIIIIIISSSSSSIIITLNAHYQT